MSDFDYLQGVELEGFDCAKSGGRKRDNPYNAKRNRFAWLWWRSGFSRFYSEKGGNDERPEGVE